MRAAKIQLDAIGPGVLRLLRDLVPCLTGRFHHQRDKKRPVRMRLLHPGNLAQIHFERAIGDQLDIVEPHDLSPVVINRSVA